MPRASVILRNFIFRSSNIIPWLPITHELVCNEKVGEGSILQENFRRIRSYWSGLRTRILCHASGINVKGKTFHAFQFVWNAKKCNLCANISAWYFVATFDIRLLVNPGIGKQLFPRRTSRKKSSYLPGHNTRNEDLKTLIFRYCNNWKCRESFSYLPIFRSLVWNYLQITFPRHVPPFIFRIIFPFRVFNLLVF